MQAERGMSPLIGSAPVARARILGVSLDLEANWTGITLVTAAEIPGENVVCIGESRDRRQLALRRGGP